MYFVDRKSLVESLIRGPVSSWQGLNYLFAIVVYERLSGLYSVLISEFGGPSQGSRSLAGVIFAIFILGLGLFLIRAILIMFYRSYGGEQSRDFLPSFLALFWVNTVRVSLVSWPVCLVIVVLIKTIPPGQFVLGIVSAFIVVVLGSLWYMIVKTNDSLREIYLGRKALAENSEPVA